MSFDLFQTKKGKPVPCPRPLAPIADTHGHLTVFRGHDPAQAIARAQRAGVRLLVVPLDPTEDARDPREAAVQLDAWCAQADGLLVAEAAAAGRADEVLAGRAAAAASAVAAECPEAAERPGGLLAAAGQADEVLTAEVAATDRSIAGTVGPFSSMGPLTQNLWTLAGVHPYGAHDLLTDSTRWDALLELLDQPRCKGVGEIGLDYHCDVPREEQMEAFARQLALAVERDLPVELHIRDADGDEAALAHADALAVMDQVGVPSAGADLHCFTSGPEVLAPFVARGCYVAFGGAVTFAKSEDIRDAALACPLSAMLSETDSPYMAPVPLRGQECEPAMTALTVAALAQLRADAGLDQPRQTYQALWDNACRFLGV